MARRHPDRIGPYRIERILGRGGMGVVYLGRHEGLDRPVAIKRVLAGLASEKALKRFLREAEALARIEHRHVVKIHELGQLPEGPYLVQEFVEGVCLEDLDAHVLAPRRAAEVCVQLADALHCLHEQGLIHRDLKPANVMIRPDGSPVLLDFGLARDVSAERLTVTGEIVGTPSYMAPEQADGERARVGPSVDIYSLGAVLFAFLARRSPFEGGGIQVLAKLLREDPRWPSEDDPTVPAELEAIVRRAMAKDPAERYPNVLALKQDLERWLGGELPVAAGGSADFVLKKRRGKGPLIVGALLLGALLTGGVAFAAAKGSEPLPSPSPTARATPTPTPTPSPTRAKLRLELLQDLKDWQRASPEDQDRVIAWLDVRLGSDFRHAFTQTFRCGELSYRIGVFVHEATGIELSLVPGGEYLRGCTDPEAELAWDRAQGARPKANYNVWATPARTTRIEPMLVGRTEVSSAQFFRGTSGELEPAGDPDLPRRVFFDQAHGWFGRVRSGLRFPSESEWEYAARAGSTTRYYWGDEFEPQGPEHVWHLGNTPGIQPVTRHAGATNAFGLSDVLGNLLEWCSDPWDYDLADHPPTAAPRPAEGAKRNKRPRRGGGARRHFTSAKVFCRSNRSKDHRVKKGDQSPLNESGFRVFRSLPELERRR